LLIIYILNINTTTITESRIGLNRFYILLNYLSTTNLEIKSISIIIIIIAILSDSSPPRSSRALGLGLYVVM